MARPSPDLGTVWVDVRPDLSRFTTATREEIIAFLADHIYGVDATVATENALGVCTRVADYLLRRYTLLPK